MKSKSNRDIMLIGIMLPALVFLGGYEAFTQEANAQSSFDLDPGNSDTESITFANDKFWVVDYGDKVYAYNSDGTRDADSDFVLHEENYRSNGIAFANDKFWVINQHSRDTEIEKVYAYNSDGTRAIDSDFEFGLDREILDGSVLSDIVFANDKFWIVAEDYVFAYNTQRIHSAIGYATPAEFASKWEMKNK